MRHKNADLCDVVDQMQKKEEENKRLMYIG